MNILLKYESKKILHRKSTLITVILMILCICILAFMFIAEYSYYDGNSGQINGLKAIHAKKAKLETFDNELSEASLKEALHQFQRVNANADNYDNTTGDIKDDVYINDILPYNDILTILRRVYSPVGTLDYYVLSSVDEKMIDSFYEKHKEKVLEILNMDYSYGNYSDAEKSLVLAKAEKIKEPWKYDYSDGWEILLTRGLLTVALIIAIGISIIIAPVFAFEYQTGADSVVLSTRHGRSRLVRTKIWVAFVVSSVIYILGMLLYSLIIFAAFGISGWNSAFQTLSITSFYGLNILQVYLSGITINYVVVLSVAAFTMYLSSACSTTFSAVIISSLYILVPMFIPSSKNSKLFNYILDLLPAKALDTFTVFSIYDIYSLGKIAVTLPVMIFTVSVLIALIALPLAFINFQRHQVA